ncbi:hypothetical protein CYY_003721 [Polysphondylium violaceum]|uniref:Pleckstrin domain-containing protein n=1 Tax=Polysphondylium violaceum TaxID=133409 RepID=A0A8J4PYP0_9MYCE|nr:hypothetical protein CYY_003721 [Polysphondylium violaceum]
MNHNSKLPKGIALYRYDATEDEELSLEEGDIVDIEEESDDGWWKGYIINKKPTQLVRKEGIFPYNYVKKLSKAEFHQYNKSFSNGGATPTPNINSSNSSSSNSSINKNEDNSNSNNNNNNNNCKIEETATSTSTLPKTSDESSTSTISIPPITNNSTLENNNSNSIEQQNNLLYQMKDFPEDHIIASLSDPLEKRNTGSPTMNRYSDDNEQFQKQQLELAQKQQQQEQPPQNFGITIQLNDIAKQGYLIKKGHIRRNWNVRWFQLRRNILTYSKTPTEPKLSGTLTLTKETEVDIATNMKRTNCFQIKIPQDNLVFYCSAQSADDMESWIQALNQAKAF